MNREDTVTIKKKKFEIGENNSREVQKGCWKPTQQREERKEEFKTLVGNTAILGKKVGEGAALPHLLL